MKNLGRALATTLLLFGQPLSEFRATTSNAVQTNAPGTPKTEKVDASWFFTSKEHGFSLTLPSSYWKRAEKKGYVAYFWCNRFGSPMIASVVSVKKQSEAAYRATVKEFKDEVEKEPDLLRKATYEDGKRKSNDLFAFITACEKGTKDSTYFYVARSYTWLKNKEATVDVLFEGQGKMQSRLFQSIEFTEYEKAAKSICLSVTAEVAKGK